MKKVVQKLLLVVAFLGVMTLLIPSYSAALPPVKLGDETELNVYGFLRNNLGMLTDNPQPFAQSSNDLATARTWFRGYTDFKITNELRFFSAVQLVYEPWYPVEKGSISEDKPKGHEYSEWKNYNDVVREFYLEWKPNKTNTIKIGRQIAIWGEAMTTRVGDVIHPDDARFGMVTFNLDDTRIPSWMIRATHDFPDINSSFEWIVNPNIVESEYRVSRVGAYSILGVPGQRFAFAPEMRFRPPFSVGNPFLATLDPALSFFANPKVVIGPPISRDWTHIPGAPGTGWFPLYNPAISEDFPSMWGDLRGGFRTNTTLSGFNFGLTYFHTQNYVPTVKRGRVLVPFTPLPPPPMGPGGVIPGVRQYTLVYPSIDIIGAYMNKQLPWPGVVRAEVAYTPNMPFNTFDPGDSDAMVRRGDIKYMIAYDLTSFLYFQWHKTAPFDVTFEHTGEIIPHNKDLQYIIYATELRQWNPSFNMRISTNWLYNLISTDLVVGYSPWGRSGLVSPSVKFMPNWFDKKLSVQLQYNHIFAKNFYQGLGPFRSKDMVLLTTQFDW